MNRRTPRLGRIHLILPKLTPQQAAVLHHVAGQLIDALWDLHGNAICDAEAQRDAHESIELPDVDRIYSLAEFDDDIDF
jgi:hypothetical protein